MSAPYYDDGQVQLWLGDCREILPALTADVLVTDPPYGIEMGVGADMRGTRNRTKAGLAKTMYASYEDTYENYVSIICPVIAQSLSMVRRGAVFSGPHLQELPKAAAVGGVYCPSASGRHQWGFKAFLPVLFYGVSPTLQGGKGAKPNVLQSTAVAEKNGHPCPKPISWMRWLVGVAALPGETVLDPFAGSGTTLVAAREVGCKAIGIEVDERYCEIAARRLSQGVLEAFG